MTKDDTNFLTAATINLYLESLRRVGRLLLAPQDIETLYDMIRVITNPLQVVTIQDTARTRELNEKERQHVLGEREIPGGLPGVADPVIDLRQRH
jgi:hypothetical protein